MKKLNVVRNVSDFPAGESSRILDFPLNSKEEVRPRPIATVDHTELPKKLPSYRKRDSLEVLGENQQRLEVMLRELLLFFNKR